MVSQPETQDEEDADVDGASDTETSDSEPTDTDPSDTDPSPDDDTSDNDPSDSDPQDNDPVGGDPGVFVPDGEPPVLTPGVWQNISPARPTAWDVWGIAIDVSNTANLFMYMCGPGEGGGGVWRSTNAGTNWHPYAPAGCATGIAVDPDDSDHAYVSYAWFNGSTFGFWETEDGGESWDEKDLSYGSDVGRFEVDPRNFNHVILSFHWVSNDAAGIIQSYDGGETWAPPAVAPWGYGGSKGIHFLGNSNTWIISTEGAFYRTDNGGTTFAQLNTHGAVGTHGGGGTTYVASNGRMYIPAHPQPISSTNGIDWTGVGNLGNSYYRVIIGDGHKLYTAGDAGSTVVYSAPEDNASTWTATSEQSFSTGPVGFAFDPIQRVLYMGDRQPGVWALKVVDP